MNQKHDLPKYSQLQNLFTRYEFETFDNAEHVVAKQVDKYDPEKMEHYINVSFEKTGDILIEKKQFQVIFRLITKQKHEHLENSVKEDVEEDDEEEEEPTPTNKKQKLDTFTVNSKKLKEDLEAHNDSRFVEIQDKHILSEQQLRSSDSRLALIQKIHHTNQRIQDKALVEYKQKFLREKNEQIAYFLQSENINKKQKEFEEAADAAKEAADAADAAKESAEAAKEAAEAAKVLKEKQDERDTAVETVIKPEEIDSIMHNFDFDNLDTDIETLPETRKKHTKENIETLLETCKKHAKEVNDLDTQLYIHKVAVDHTKTFLCNMCYYD